MSRVLADPPSRSGHILTKRELDAALRVLAALRRPQPASVVMNWDNDMQDVLGGLQRARYVETRPAYGGRSPRKSSAQFRPDMLATTELGSEYLESIQAAQRGEPKRHHSRAKVSQKETMARIERATYQSMRDYPEAYPPGALAGVSKKTAARLDREIAEAIAKRTSARSHATRKKPLRVAYRLQLTPSELRAVEFARGRYAWPDMLSAHASDGGLVAFTEPEMWQWTDDVDSDAEGGHAPFPLASDALAAKLQRFYDDRI